MDMTSAQSARLEQFKPVTVNAARPAVHVGMDDLPFLPVSAGESFQLIQVYLAQGLWIVRSRFQPNTTLTRHFHTGPVFAVTLSGTWHYLEYPEQINTPGSYLFEPAGSIHTLHIPPQEEITDVWFSIYGSNLALDDDGRVLQVTDAAHVLEAYRKGCEKLGVSHDKVIVLGE